MITVSENAKQKALALIKEENKPADTFIRVGVESGGCSGLSYKMEFDNQIKEGDQVFEDKGMKIVVDKKSFLYLVGTELDFSGGLNGKGFEFKNPNASRTCGCGESFAVKNEAKIFCLQIYLE
jgi:iron-sulfur cluster assembly protein